MAADKPRLARLIAILTQLLSKRIVTAREIANKHKVSIRTVYRDIRTLEQSGIPITVEEGKGYTILNGYRLPPVMFSEEEANALVTGEQIISNNCDVSLSTQYNSAIEKIKSVLKYSQKDKAELLSQRLQIRSKIEPKNSTNNLLQIQSAITNYQVIRLHYISADKEETQRFIEPFALLHTQSNWNLIAYCRLRNAFRYFRLDRIESLSKTSEKFKPHGITLQQYFEEQNKIYSSTPDIPLTQGHSTFASHQKIIVMEKVNIAPFKVIGISVRTINRKGQSTKDIGQLWNKFMKEGILEKIPNRIDNSILSMYTNYDGDHTQAYDTILGCKVNSLENIPEGMVGQSFDGGTYGKFVSKGDITKGVVLNTWNEIWNADLNRTYTADFELYGEKALNPTDAEVDILVAIKE
ncbi:MAG: effector binding domain-containing protein [Marinifilaceae bacterium]